MGSWVWWMVAWSASAVASPPVPTYDGSPCTTCRERAHTDFRASPDDVIADVFAGLGTDGREVTATVHGAVADTWLVRGGDEDLVVKVLSDQQLQSERVGSRLVRHLGAPAPAMRFLERRTTEMAASIELTAVDLPAAPAAGDAPCVVHHVFDLPEAYVPRHMVLARVTRTDQPDAAPVEVRAPWEGRVEILVTDGAELPGHGLVARIHPRPFGRTDGAGVAVAVMPMVNGRDLLHILEDPIARASFRRARRRHLESLGRLAAIDLIMAQQDRLLSQTPEGGLGEPSANLGNVMFELRGRRVVPRAPAIAVDNGMSEAPPAQIEAFVALATTGLPEVATHVRQAIAAELSLQPTLAGQTVASVFGVDDARFEAHLLRGLRAGIAAAAAAGEPTSAVTGAVEPRDLAAVELVSTKLRALRDAL